jgi:hypothetical protein
MIITSAAHTSTQAVSPALIGDCTGTAAAVAVIAAGADVSAKTVPKAHSKTAVKTNISIFFIYFLQKQNFLPVRSAGI